VIGIGLLLPLFVASPAQAAPTQVVVHRGDTLSALAARYCGSWSKWPSLFAANPSIKDANRIYVGQRLTINCNLPARSSTSSASRSSSRTTTVPAASSWTHPLPGAYCSSDYGMRWGSMHQGVDLTMGGAFGRPIHAASAGTVAVVRWDAGGYGWYAVIAHSGGYLTLYGHMRYRPVVSVGQHVAVGQQIGQVGSTGDSTGPHTHFEVHKGLWHRIDPSPFMRARGVVVGC
jgi:murein DD-endopeptidase MepM/ murein hydrolase activator NlpD